MQSSGHMAMLVPDNNKLGQMCITWQIWHVLNAFSVAGDFGVVEILILMRIYVRLGVCLYTHRVVLLKKELVTGRLLLAAFPSLHDSFVGGDNDEILCLYKTHTVLDVWVFCLRKQFALL